MSTREMLKQVKGLRDELISGQKRNGWPLRRTLSRLMLKTCELQLDYAKLRAKGIEPIGFLESAKPFSKRDLKNIDDAHAVDKEIRNHLSEMRKARKKSL